MLPTPPKVSIEGDASRQNYHDPSVALQPEDMEYYRYHPLLLNAAFLGNLTSEDQRILGFGNKTNYIPAFTKRPKHKTFQALHQRALGTKVLAEEFGARVGARLNKLIGAK
jgi:hypothetical protein